MSKSAYSDNSGKVFFLVSNLYIHLRPFRRICSALEAQGVESELFYIESETNDANANESGGGEKDLKKLPHFKGGGQSKSHFALARRFYDLARNKKSFEKFLKEKRPALFVTGGDITDPNGRLVHDSCRRAGIKTLIVPVTIPGPAFVNPDPSKGVPFVKAARAAAAGFAMEETIFFRGWVLGSYDKKAKIALPDKSAFDLLRENGIEEKRLYITGNPVNDEIFEMARRTRREIEQKVKSDLGIASEKKIILYCTEMIQDVYGKAYLESNIAHLEKACSEIPDEYIVLVKFHPREPQSIKDLYRERLKGPRYAFTEGTNVLELIRSSDLVIAHYSAVFKDAALIGSPLLSIMADPGMPVLFGIRSEWIHAEPDALGEKMKKLLLDAKFRDEQKRIISAYFTEMQIINDGMVCDRIARLISAAAGKQEQNKIH